MSSTFLFVGPAIDTPGAVAGGACIAAVTAARNALCCIFFYKSVSTTETSDLIVTTYRNRLRFLDHFVRIKTLG